MRTYIHTVPSSGDQHKVLKEVDFAISLGGDGTLLYTASLFEVQVVGYRAGVGIRSVCACVHTYVHQCCGNGN